MRGCHNCEHQGKDWPSWEQSPCSKCHDPEFSELQGGCALDEQAASEVEPAAEGDFPGPAQALIRFVLSMDIVDFHIFRALLDNPRASCRELAAVTAMTWVGVHKRKQRMLNEFPFLAAVLKMDMRYRTPPRLIANRRRRAQMLGRKKKTAAAPDAPEGRLRAS